MRISAAGSALALGLVLMGAASTARAERLSGELPMKEDAFVSCSSFSADILQWTPADGPAATFIADAFERSGASLWVGLGYDASGFWSAESAAASDACDDCNYLDLVHTSFTGTRTVYAVVDSVTTPATSLRQALKTRLFGLAASRWPVARLSHDYKLRLPKRDPEGRIEKFSGWMAEVSKRGGFLLRFGQTSTSSMCWCSDDWNGYALAKK
jgi:hypothetical protein